MWTNLEAQVPGEKDRQEQNRLNAAESQLLTCRIGSDRSSWPCSRLDNRRSRESLGAREGMGLADCGDLARRKSQLTARLNRKSSRGEWHTLVIVVPGSVSTEVIVEGACV